jgi:alpha-L-fucosidase
MLAFKPNEPVAEFSPQCPFRRINPLDVSITLPNSSPTIPDKADTVIVLNCAGDIQTDTNRLLQPAFPVETLRAFDGELHGQGLKFGPGKKTDDVVMDWTKTNQFISWPVRETQAAKYEVIINYDASADSASSTFRVLFELRPELTTAMGPEILTGTVKAGNSQTESLGTVSVWGTLACIKISPVEIHGGELMRLRNLQLKPVNAN